MKMSKVCKRSGKTFGRRVSGLLIFMVFSLLSLCGAYAAEYPSKPIQMILTAAAGGSSDTLTRILCKRLPELLGKPVTVVNKVGGGTVVGTVYVLGLPPDGHTLLCTEGLVVTPLIVKDIGYTVKDFTPFSVAVSTPMFVFVNKNAPWNTLEEFIADAKKNPGKFTYSSGAPGTISRLAGELFQRDAGIKLTNVAYTGISLEAMTAVLGGHVTMACLSSMMCKPQYEAGKIKMLAAMYPKRFKDFPDVPTVAEKGFPGMIATMWLGYFVHAKTPQPIVRKLYDTFQTLLNEKETATLVEQAGFVIENLEWSEIPKFMAKEHEKWSDIVKIVKQKEGT
jgi:tripartite-type tricarboxylate transporter receptor subunit TctC